MEEKLNGLKPFIGKFVELTRSSGKKAKYRLVSVLNQRLGVPVLACRHVEGFLAYCKLDELKKIELLYDLPDHLVDPIPEEK